MRLGLQGRGYCRLRNGVQAMPVAEPGDAARGRAGAGRPDSSPRRRPGLRLPGWRRGRLPGRPISVRGALRAAVRVPGCGRRRGVGSGRQAGPGSGSVVSAGCGRRQWPGPEN